MKSDELILLAGKEDNDAKAFALYAEANREQRSETFEKHAERLTKKGYIVVYYKGQEKYTVRPTKHGIIDYYPKTDRLILRTTGKWLNSGFKWILNNL